MAKIECNTRKWITGALHGCVLVLAGCGGGGGSAPLPSPPPAPPPASLPPSSTLANQCTLDTERRFVRSVFDEIYLWYRDVPAVTATSFTSTYDYFEALKTPLKTASGSPVDKFSFAVTQAEWDLREAAAEVSHGVKWQADNAARAIVALDVEANSAAGRAGVQRGWKITAVNGVPLNQLTAALANTAVFAPAAGTTTNFTLVNRAGTQVSLALRADRVDYSLVPETRVLTTPQGPVGYLVLRFWGDNAQNDLAAAIKTMSQSNVRDLVLDLRYNEGGSALPVLQLAYMVAGERVRDKVLLRIRANDKRPGLARDEQALAFKVDPATERILLDQPLPALNLSRVFVLTTEDTCSASELLINGLKPYVDVIQIGATTCGKPYGFNGVSNCGKIYAPMELSATNAASQGHYSDGIDARCVARDDVSRDLGDASETLLRTALDFARTGSCPPATTAVAQDANDLQPWLLLKRPQDRARSSMKIGRPIAVQRSEQPAQQ